MNHASPIAQGDAEEGIKMPICFQFLKDDEPALLNDVDKELCEWSGATYSEKQYCQSFLVLRDLGLAASLYIERMKLNSNEGRLTKEMLQDYLRYESENSPAFSDYYLEQLDRIDELADWMCGGKYQFYYMGRTM